MTTTASAARAATYSANAPRQVPNTSSPGRNVVTPVPTAQTRPASYLRRGRARGKIIITV